MDLTLVRDQFLPTGIFGTLTSDDGSLKLNTLEHSYLISISAPIYMPKIPSGSYVCTKGEHQLTHMTYPFETFEVTGVKGHTGLLFHKGNFNNDSSGCILLGLYRALPDSLIHSTEAFDKFMAFQWGSDSFHLSVL